MSGRPIRSSFLRVGPRAFRGYATDTSDLTHKFAVEILVDGLAVKLISADAYDGELAQTQVGDGCYGFYVSLPEEFVSARAIVEARLANRGEPVGAPIVLDEPFEANARHSGSGALRWVGGLRFSGWIDTIDPDAVVTLTVDGVPVMRARAMNWTHVGSGDEGARAVRAFDAHLPQRFGDGVVHQAGAVNAKGEKLAGSPLAFLAFVGGLDESMLADGVGEQNRERAEMFNRLMPASVPFSDYEGWRRRSPAPDVSVRPARCAIVLVGAGNADETLASLEAGGTEGWTAAVLPTSSGFASFASLDLLEFLAHDCAACDFVLFALAGTVIAPFALQRIALAFETFAAARCVYADFDAQGPDGDLWPVALTAFDYERLLEQGYCAYLYALRRESALRSASNGAGDLYQLFFGAFEGDNAAMSDIVHVPGAFGALPAFDVGAAGQALARASQAHLRTRGFDVAVSSSESTDFPSVWVQRSLSRPSVTLIVPTRNQPKLLRNCLISLQSAAERVDTEVMIVDNDSTDLDALEHLAELRDAGATVLRVPGPFNFARLNNRAAEAASGDVLCLVNDDVEAQDDGWLGEMLGRLADPAVGAVGALLFWPSGVVQHGGVVLGPKFEAAHAFRDRLDGEPGYANMLRVARECSAVTAACLATRRNDYFAVGGMDELSFPINFNDVDYCLKLRAAGKRIVFTPHAKLLHHESASRGSDRASDRRPRYERELRNLRAKWGDVLASDPYYSPALALDGNPYSALASPLRPMTPRVNHQPIAREPPAWA